MRPHILNIDVFGFTLILTLFLLLFPFLIPHTVRSLCLFWPLPLALPLFFDKKGECAHKYLTHATLLTLPESCVSDARNSPTVGELRASDTSYEVTCIHFLWSDLYTGDSSIHFIGSHLTIYTLPIK